MYAGGGWIRNSPSPKWGYEVQVDDEEGWTLGPEFAAHAATGAVAGLVSAHRVLSHTVHCVAPGAHTLRVRTFDENGVRSAAPAAAAWTQVLPGLPAALMHRYMRVYDAPMRARHPLDDTSLVERHS
jgi:hypothetical protein